MSIPLLATKFLIPPLRRGRIRRPHLIHKFDRASAVVTDAGEPLSHGSIVAREYGIPAVLGTGTAIRRIRTGQKVTVDGNAGVVSLEIS